MTTQRKQKRSKRPARSRKGSTAKAAPSTAAKELAWARSQFKKVLVRAKAAEARAEAAEHELAQTKARHASDALGFIVAKQRHEQLLTWVGLNKPALLKLEKLVARHAATGSAGLNPSLVLHVAPRKRLPRTFDATTTMGNPVQGYEPDALARPDGVPLDP